MFSCPTPRMLKDKRCHEIFSTLKLDKQTYSTAPKELDSSNDTAAVWYPGYTTSNPAQVNSTFQADFLAV